MGWRTDTELTVLTSCFITGVFIRVKTCSMLSKAGYINNLSLCDEYRTVKDAVVEWVHGKAA